MTSMQLIKRFANNKIANSLNLTVEDIQRCLARWSEPHRFYHGLNHLFTLIDNIDEFDKHDIIHFNDEDKELLDIIALFHDLVYDPRSKTNEVDSAQAFSACISKSCESSEIINQVILDTEYGKWCEPSSEISKMFRLFDWEIPLYRSSMYDLITAEKQIYREYQYVTHEEYVKNRVDFIEFAMDKASDNTESDLLLELKVWVEHYRPKIGVYAGSFNPFHTGHLNILEQAERVFDKVIILAAKNSDKNGVTYEDAVEEILPFHEVVGYRGLTTNYLNGVRDYADVTLIRGLRNGYDLQYEANLRRFMEEIGEVDVMYFLSGLAYQHISSSDIRGLHKLSESDYNRYIPTKYSYYTKSEE